MINIILCKRRPGKAPEELRIISTAETERAAERLAESYSKFYQQRGNYIVIAKEAKSK